MIENVKDPSLEAHNLTVFYQKRPAIWNLDFTLPKGKIIGIMGPNGSGKSTLLKSIMGILKPNDGWVKVFQRKIDDVRFKVSYVPQRQSIDWDFPTNVFEVAKMGRISSKGLFKRFSKTDLEIVKESLHRVNMYDMRNRQISELSGGQQQRTFLARALSQEADLFIMDEPFAGVDAASEKAIIGLLNELKSKGKTLLVVHHDLHSAKNYFDWLVLLNTRLVGSGPLEKLYTDELLSETYGGTLTSLSKIATKIEKQGLPIRHK